MENKVLFAVSDKNSNDLEVSGAIFDTRDKAEAFCRKFKENSEFVIQEVRYNPSFTIIEDQSPYRVEFSTYKDDCESTLADYSYYEISRDIQYEITEFGGHYFLSVFLLAKDEVDAILKACEKRDELRANGEFPRGRVF